jgi:hypothetical protein
MQMVNAGFPARSRYGFEMVDGHFGPSFCEKAAINRKFTPNPISRIYRKFSII